MWGEEGNLWSRNEHTYTQAQRAQSHTTRARTPCHTAGELRRKATTTQFAGRMNAAVTLEQGRMDGKPMWCLVDCPTLPSKLYPAAMAMESVQQHYVVQQQSQHPATLHQHQHQQPQELLYTSGTSVGGASSIAITCAPVTQTINTDVGKGHANIPYSNKSAWLFSAAVLSSSACKIITSPHNIYKMWGVYL